MKWALLSVWDKTGVIELARVLLDHGFQVISSGGTAQFLRDHGIEVMDIAEYTGFPEMMDGRVKTLHPKVHGGLLGRRGTDDRIMADHAILPIDLLIVNLYPFEKMLSQALTFDEMIEFIDVGGPAMIRAAAKNHRDVAVVVDPEDYPLVYEALRDGGFTAERRLYFARKAFARTAAYDSAISNYIHTIDAEFPEVLFLHYRHGRPLRYGENPHQKGAVYGGQGIAGQHPLQGKQMSYNNYLDTHAAVMLLREFGECCTVIVKHNNPCGVAIGSPVVNSYVTARGVDPEAAYGSIVAINRAVDGMTAREIISTFVEVLIAPGYTDEASHILASKENLRVLTLPAPANGDEMRTIDGGILVQRTPPYHEEWKVVTTRPPSADECAAMKLGWRVCKHTRSNAIILANTRKTLGIGAGQMSRVDAARLAIEKAREPLKGSVVASDAFIPFPDTLRETARSGATALIQPGGSIRDKEVIATANELNMAMVFTGTRYFKH